MKLNISRSRNDLAIDIDSIAALIVNTQRESGEIPWFNGEKTDPSCRGRNGAKHRWVF